MILIIIIIIVLLLLYFLYWNSKSSTPEPKQKSLYDRLGGIYNIAAVVDHFSDAVVKNPLAGENSPNPDLRDWYKTKMSTRLPGLKWMRTLWVADITGGPYKYVPTVAGKCPMSLENAHKNLKISPQEFDAVAQELAKSLDHFSVPAKEKAEVLEAFAKHKSEVDTGYMLAEGESAPQIKCPF